MGRVGVERRVERRENFAVEHGSLDLSSQAMEQRVSPTHMQPRADDRKQADDLNERMMMMCEREDVDDGLNKKMMMV